MQKKIGRQLLSTLHNYSIKLYNISMMKKVFKNQVYHLIIYILFGSLLYLATIKFPEGQGSSLGLTTFELIAISWILAGIHQFWIAFFWRTEFYLGLISRWMGDKGFLIYRIGFVVFALSRLLLVIPISISSAHTLFISPWISMSFILIPTPFILWGIYSVVFYFGLTRAFGADHFDPSYRNKTLEIRGIFKYIPNSMYTIILLVLYQPGLFFNSKLGIIAAFIHHAFVWTHYFCTEKPDIKEIYGKN